MAGKIKVDMKISDSGIVDNSYYCFNKLEWQNIINETYRSYRKRN